MTCLDTKILGSLEVDLKSWYSNKSGNRFYLDIVAKHFPDAVLRGTPGQIFDKHRRLVVAFSPLASCTIINVKYAVVK